MLYDLGERITSLRKSMNLSQEALAERIGVSRQAISKWERNEATPDIYNLTSLAEVFGITIDEIISDDIYSVQPQAPKIIGLELKNKAEKFMMLGIGLLVMSAFAFIAVPGSGEAKFAVFGLMITGGIVLIIRSSFLTERFKLLNKNLYEDEYSQEEVSFNKTDKKKKNAFSSIVSISCTVIYLYLGFFHMLWHPGWLIFLMIPVSASIYDFVYLHKRA